MTDELAALRKERWPYLVHRESADGDRQFIGRARDVEAVVYGDIYYAKDLFAGEGPEGFCCSLTVDGLISHRSTHSKEEWCAVVSDPKAFARLVAYATFSKDYDDGSRLLLMKQILGAVLSHRS
ncbi:hypothetical protein [Rhodobium gokarnense]|uniref:Uncharacterized protein n=1 Tax=Rhodobium gokarnense TaxID=364296 RepID=A0ABT3HH55_9HYPH|nr:hypothetical protein [Rhodobium gokarnense]MCW2309726.1 hypothetical protein [Rhodobium gokarnense]